MSDTFQHWWRSCPVVLGMDVGKKGNPSHSSVFAIKDDPIFPLVESAVGLDRKDNNGYPIQNMIMIHQKFMDGWEYTRQISYLNAAVEYFNVQRGYYDNTRAELEERGLPRQIMPVALESRDGPKSKSKYGLATNFSKLVEQKRIWLIDDDRFISQITCLVPGSRIYSKGGGIRNRWKGYKAIENFKAGDWVKTHQNRYRRVTKIFSRQVDEEAVELKLDNNEIILLTKNHPILTKEGWKPAGALTLGDVLIKIVNCHSPINRPAKGQTYEEYYGEEKAKNVRSKESISQTGKHCVERVIWLCPVCGKTLWLREKSAKARKVCCKDCEGQIYKDAVKNRPGFGASGLNGADNPNYNPNKINRPYGLAFTLKLKRYIWKRDNYTCQNCGKTHTQVHCHHIDYDKNNNDEHNLITLCHSCHSKTTYTKKREYWKTLFQTKILLIYGKVQNGTHIKRIAYKHYSGLVYNLEVEEDHSYVGHGIIFHNCVTNDLQAAETPLGHGDSFISCCLAIGAYYDFFARDRRTGFADLGNIQSLVSERGPNDLVTAKSLPNDICKICGKNKFQILPNGQRKCLSCMTLW